MKQFEGKTAVVTGAASGIGRALAERFAQARMQVVLADIEKDALDRAVQELEQRQYRVIGVVANTMVRESVEALAKRATDEFGKVHIVCNNAGIAAMAGGIKPIWEVSDRDWQWVMGVNFYGVLYGIQAFVPGMLAHGEEGHIVNTASLAGVMPGGGTYGVSKHGVLSLTETLHQNLTMMGAKIGASVLCPGFVNTNIFDAERHRPKELSSAASGAQPSPEMQEMGRAMLAAGKQPSDVAEIVFESIRENRFYILPHPAWDPIVRARVDAILARGAPMTLDMQEMMKRRAAGEQF
ncbi:MAG TPA: SDR family NAD(P)-dependent oxidoreductase [Pseudomonadales bacterium]|jgi:NAD(P)-dependent dehydrogenase (short-subunit alcohol dehydrogenase family)|nr:SDR family NAD(P)-dependent oxidoreductase [Pseudomonadales bacterium]